MYSVGISQASMKSTKIFKNSNYKTLHIMNELMNEYNTFNSIVMCAHGR